MMSPDEIDALFQQMVAYLREEASLLRRISDNRIQAGLADDGANAFADKLDALLRECLAATAGTDPAERLKMEVYWGMRFSSIDRIVDIIDGSYVGSSYAGAQEAVQERIYQTANRLADDFPYH